MPGWPEVSGQMTRLQFLSPLPSRVKLGTSRPPTQGWWVLSPRQPPWPAGCPAGSSPGLHRGLTWSPRPPRQRKAQIACTAIFIVWGVLVHLVIPPFVFMVTEEWDYIEGLYYSFITISTIGFGDFVAGESCPLPLPPPPAFLCISSTFNAADLSWGAPEAFSVLGLHPVGSLPRPANCKRTPRHRVIAEGFYFPGVPIVLSEL